MKHDPDSALEDARTRDDLVYVTKELEGVLRDMPAKDRGTLEHVVALGAWSIALGLKYAADMLYDIRDILDEGGQHPGADSKVTPLPDRRGHDDQTSA